MDVLLINIIIAIPTLFLIRWVLKKINPLKGSFKNPLLWIATIIVTPIIYSILILTWISIETYYPEREFDKKEWAENVEKRYEYADDLVDNKKLIGLSRKEIIEILGKPENEGNNSMTYYLGFSPRHFFGIDPDYLKIEFENGKVVSTNIYTS